MVKIIDVLPTTGILTDFRPKDKRDALEQLAQFMATLNNLKSPDTVIQSIVQREAEMSTGIGYGIAIPHARIEGLDRLHMVCARVKAGLEFDSLDELPVNLIFMMISPTNTAADHTQILSSLTRVVSYEEIRQQLLNAPDAQAFREILIAGENKYVS